MFTVRLKETPTGIVATGRGRVKFAAGPTSNRRLVAQVLPVKLDYTLPTTTELTHFFAQEINR